ncbi:MAG: UDP-2,3-diacylglucosamine diphosphatase LpxI [Aquificaceae bacterium]|nr:UDP-2,3-diacylglucosamine diphosphatase LpxI [Aquificaceae bacterium]MDW8236788.1 UDP-2,3-diacylglucosamine diphosphatase LpxI [Aquificaceae bacterium]
MKIALIAGKGDLPEAFLKGAISSGADVLVVGINGITTLRSDIKVAPGEVAKLVSLLEGVGYKDVVLLGKFEPKDLFLPILRLDSLATEILRSSPDKRPKTIIETFMKKLEALGFSFPDPMPFLKELLCPKGQIVGEPSSEALEDGVWGFKIAKEVAQMDIGQTITVKQKSIIAVEAMEGTQESIKRSAKLVGRGFRVIKVARKTQDPRIDMPAIGPKTIKLMAKVRADAIFLESDKVILIEKEKTIKLAARYCVAMLGLCSNALDAPSGLPS